MNADNGIYRHLRSLNCDGRRGAWLLASLALLLLPLVGADTWRDALRLDRELIAQGQWWRLVTAHLVHLDARHALVNAAGLALLWALFARMYTALQWWVILAAIIVCIDVGLWWLQPHLGWYVGASGVLHGIFAAGCLALLRARSVAGWLAGIVFIAKLAWEQWQGPLPFSGTHLVIVDAHLYGALGGVLTGLAMGRRLY